MCKRREYYRQYRRDHPEPFAAYHKIWYTQNKEKVKGAVVVRRAFLKLLPLADIMSW